jgi:uncharacterized protein
MKQKQSSNPYLAGLLLGGTLLASYLLLGVGLGASSAIARMGAFCELAVAPARTLASRYFGAYGEQPLEYYLVFMFLGVVCGGVLSALLSGRGSFTLERGQACSRGKRVLFALLGGLIVGYASRMANGCTSGQALSGGALLLSGSLLFLISVFVGGYMTAYFVRRQWHD